MHKKFLRTFGLIVLILNSTALATPYDDENGKLAPSNVRRAAEALSEAYQNHTKQHKCSSYTVLEEVSCFCYNYTEITKRRFHISYGTNTKPLRKDYIDLYHPTPHDAKLADYSYNELKQMDKMMVRVINENVKNPVHYEGDLSLNTSLTLYDDGRVRLDETVEAYVLKLANRLGGWK